MFSSIKKKTSNPTVSSTRRRVRRLAGYLVLKSAMSYQKAEDSKARSTTSRALSHQEILVNLMTSTRGIGWELKILINRGTIEEILEASMTWKTSIIKIGIFLKK